MTEQLSTEVDGKCQFVADRMFSRTNVCLYVHMDASVYVSFPHFAEGKASA